MFEEDGVWTTAAGANATVWHTRRLNQSKIFIVASIGDSIFYSVDRYYRTGAELDLLESVVCHERDVIRVLSIVSYRCAVAGETLEVSGKRVIN